MYLSALLTRLLVLAAAAMLGQAAIRVFLQTALEEVLEVDHHEYMACSLEQLLVFRVSDCEKQGCCSDENLCFFVWT